MYLYAPFLALYRKYSGGTNGSRFLNSSALGLFLSSNEHLHGANG
jgi:hypothetical protein